MISNNLMEKFKVCTKTEDLSKVGVKKKLNKEESNRFING